MTTTAAGAAPAASVITTWMKLAVRDRIASDDDLDDDLDDDDDYEEDDTDLDENVEVIDSPADPDQVKKD